MATLNKDIFGLTVENHELVKLAYDAYLANSRSSHAKTLKRGEVRGGGKKPWRQKGTGRARFGSTRNPIWRHGGVAFGRTGEENFTKKLAKSSKRLAVRQALSMKNADKAVFVLDKDVKLTGKTKDAVKILKDMKLDGKNVLAVAAEKTPEVLRSTNNLPNIKLVRATYLNVFDIMNADAIVFSEAALKATENWLIGEEK
ncbi:MAG: 50S ribosomal protein L4 [Candidatus Saccharibacteria bacterium]|uniref:Large ribosomal subunit protein uL4 n=1 Tax=Candidatus Nanosyncoccus alces TaxID=2171997 RepID=A0ABY0FML1_9BACT|nr:50S ribosomal protein L4 [Candidatus Nanosyncoccus alces]MDO4399237.1 50S ribosomal protein L4 [Candidatus Saccharibacteria bacterium]RYC75163.1 50S ribosomal protein L4 [Candidatus Nanosyncoccus alces]